MKSAIHRKVMRRVYYSYGLSIVGHAMFWQGIVLGGCIALFGRLTHVAALIDNFLAVPVASAPSFIVNNFLNAATHGELLTALIVVAMVGISVSFARKALPLVLPQRMVVG